MTAKHQEMMALPVESRRDFFRRAYTLELGRAHAKGGFRWPIEMLPELVERVMSDIMKRRVPSGSAYDATMKFFGLTTQKALFAFLEV